MLLPALALLSVAFVGAGFGLAYRLAPQHRRGKHLQWLLSWTVKGLILPFLFWLLMNIGLSWWLHPFMPQIQAAQNKGGPWVGTLFMYCIAGFFIISSYWAAITLLWTLLREARGLKDEALIDFKGLCATSLIGLALPALGIFVLGRLAGAGFGVALLLTGWLQRNLVRDLLRVGSKPKVGASS